MRATAVVIMLLVAVTAVDARQARRTGQAPEPFVNPYSPEEIHNKQGVIETAEGTIVIDLLADKAPNHVALFIKTARDGGYDGTTFHRLVPGGLIQGGDPLTKDPAAADRYGTGGLNLLAREPNDELHTRGAVSAVLVPNQPDSAGTQFFVCVVDQTALDGTYTVFGRVAEGMSVAERLSRKPADGKGVPAERLVMTRVTIRERPPDVPPPFSTESPAELAAYRAVLETSMGNITLRFTPDKALEHVRNFLRLAQAGVYDGTSFHRVVKGFMVQTGHYPTRREPLDDAQMKWVHDLKAEINDQVHDRGTVSMARLDDPDSASTSFFIVTARTPSLDGQYTVFGAVESGFDVLDRIENVPVNGDAPIERVELTHVRVIGPGDRGDDDHE